MIALAERPLRRFVILFDGKEGTSPLVRLLDNFERISIVHQIENSGWEPFDRHNCGEISLSNLSGCVDLVFGRGPLDMERLNRLYTETATRPLECFEADGSVGFKMRFRAHKRGPKVLRQSRLWQTTGGWLYNAYQQRQYKKVMLETFARHNVVVFFAVRQDTLRWALSQYHGDGSGKRGDLQFRLASGEIGRDQIRSIHVDCDELEKLLRECDKRYARKRKLMGECEAAGIECFPLLYEDFCREKIPYLERICRLLDVPVTPAQLESVLAQGAYFEKVHSDDISDFVENHAEVLERFGERHSHF